MSCQVAIVVLRPARARSTGLRGLVTAVAAAVVLGACAHARTVGPVSARRVAMSDSARRYLDLALDTLRRVTLRSDTVSWSILSDSALLLAEGAQRPADTYAAIAWALHRANKHSFLQVSSVGAASAMVGRRFGYIHVPQRGGEGIPLADSLHRAVRALQDSGACGWIVDLRDNGGGNMWPMLAGIGPLLGDTIVGSFHSEDTIERWYYRSGVSGIISAAGKLDTVTRVTAPVVPPVDTANPVAVLFNGGTGSSGEAVTIAFLGRPRTRTFGTASAGFATVNRGARLPDGANMVVTVGYNADRRGTLHIDRIAPDTLVYAPPGWPSPTDRVSAAAAAWLAGRGSCAQRR
jgi:carboxyl-terminal processing protease